MSDDYREAVKLKKRINVFYDSEALDDAAILTDLNSMLKIRHFKLYWNTAVPLGKCSRTDGRENLAKVKSQP